MPGVERALIVASGTRLPHDLPRWISEASHVVAADGGANLIRDFQAAALTILGDFDSIDPSFREYFAHAAVLHREDQESTDFQKALQYTVQDLRAESISVVASEGDLLDHTLSALSSASALADEARIRFVFERSIATLVGPSRSPVQLRSRPGIRVSLIPLAAAVVAESSGLKYSPSGLQLAIGGRDGVSNEAVGDSVMVALESGVLAVFTERWEGEDRW